MSSDSRPDSPAATVMMVVGGLLLVGCLGLGLVAAGGAFFVLMAGRSASSTFTSVATAVGPGPVAATGAPALSDEELGRVRALAEGFVRDWSAGKVEAVKGLVATRDQDGDMLGEEHADRLIDALKQQLPVGKPLTLKGKFQTEGPRFHPNLVSLAAPIERSGGDGEPAVAGELSLDFVRDGSGWKLIEVEWAE